MPTGCAADAGYSGGVTATFIDPFYSEDLVAEACPTGSTGTDIPSGCTTDAGYEGQVDATTSSPFYDTNTAPSAVPCPTGSSGSGVPTGCAADAGYSGAVTATVTAPFYSEDLAAVMCPYWATGNVPGTSGTGGASGCIVKDAYDAEVSAVTATTVAPYWEGGALVVVSDSDGDGVPTSSAPGFPIVSQISLMSLAFVVIMQALVAQ